MRFASGPSTLCAVLMTLGAVGRLAAQTSAAEPVIQAPTHVPHVSAFIVNVQGLQSTDKFSWHAIPPTVQLADLVDRGSGRPVLFVSPTHGGPLHLVLAYLAPEGEPRQASVTVTIGGDPPVPPGPGPVPPDPPPPVVQGQRHILLVRESADSNPALARLITSLRNPPHAPYLTAKKHKLSILDDDAKGPDGRPSPAVEAWRPHLAGLTLPALVIADITDPNATKLVYKESLPATATADTIMATLRAHGG